MPAENQPTPKTNETLSDAANLPIESIANPGGYNPIGEVPSKLILGRFERQNGIQNRFTTLLGF